MAKRSIRMAFAAVLVLTVTLVFLMPTTHLPASKIKRPLLMSAQIVEAFDFASLLPQVQAWTAENSYAPPQQSLPLVDKNCCRQC